MDKKYIQQRVLLNGKPIPLKDFAWDGKTKTFSSTKDSLVVDFSGIDGCTFKTGWDCTFKTGSGCTFKTGSGCTFKTGWDCTFKTGSGCTFKTGSECVVVRRDLFEVIQSQTGDFIQLCPTSTPGHLKNGMYNGEPHILADGILSKIISQKGDVYRVVNHGESEQSYLVKNGEVWSHGKTLKEAKEGLIYKLSDRDTSKYESLSLNSQVTFSDAVSMYRSITGACESGVRYFVEQNAEKKKDKYTVRELIDLTQGQYNHAALVAFFTTPASPA